MLIASEFHLVHHKEPTRLCSKDFHVILEYVNEKASPVHKEVHADNYYSIIIP